MWRYGAFADENVPPFESFLQIASIHYEQPEPVLSVRKLDRTVQVSHWGNHVAIEDEILLVNDGPK